MEAIKVGKSAWEDVMMVSQNLRDNFRGLDTAEINTIGFLAFSFIPTQDHGDIVDVILLLPDKAVFPFGMLVQTQKSKVLISI